MSQWDSKTGQQGLAAWREDRADLRAGIIRESDERADGYVADRAEPSEPEPATTPTPDTWSLRCRCGALATHRLVYVWVGDGAAERDVCDVHYDTALDFFERVKDQPAVAGLRILVAS